LETKELGVIADVNQSLEYTPADINFKKNQLSPLTPIDKNLD
jgi:hypothetical protein